MDSRSRGAIVLADGEVPGRRLLDAAWPGWDTGLELVVAADGGARHAEALGLHVDLWVGDGDSIDAPALIELERAGAKLLRVEADKDETDTELAIALAVREGAVRMVILGALGGPRIDHALANVGLLGHPALAAVRAVIYDAIGARLSTLVGPGEQLLDGRPGDIVSLLPVGGTARGVTTTNLRYPLAGEDLELGRTRGISNVRIAAQARVSLESGRLLVIETPATVDS